MTGENYELTASQGARILSRFLSSTTSQQSTMRLSLILSVVVSAVAATDTCASSADPQACTFRQTFLDLAQSDPSSTSSQPEALEPLPKPAVGYFMRNMTPGATARATIPNAPSWLQGHKIYRIAPGNFPDYMTYHYDGSLILHLLPNIAAPASQAH